MKKWAVLATESGIHIVVNDILTMLQAYRLKKEIEKELFHYKELTGKHIDEEFIR
jgi:hypothetical protein